MKKIIFTFLLLIKINFIFNSEKKFTHEEHLKKIQKAVEQYVPVPAIAELITDYAKPKGLVFYNIATATEIAPMFACFYDKNHPTNAFKEFNILKAKIAASVYIEPTSLQKIFKYLNIPHFNSVISISPKYPADATFLQKYIDNSKTRHCNYTTKKDDFLKIKLEDADVIYYEHKFSPQYMYRFLEKINELKNGLIIITNYEFPKDYQKYGFELIKTFKLPTTLSKEALFYIYKLNKKITKNI